MDATKAIDISTKVFVAAAAIGIGFVIYQAISFDLELARSYENMRQKNEESNRMMKETLQHATRVFKAGEAHMSDIQDVINGDTTFLEL